MQLTMQKMKKHFLHTVNPPANDKIPEEKEEKMRRQEKKQKIKLFKIFNIIP